MNVLICNAQSPLTRILRSRTSPESCKKAIVSSFGQIKVQQHRSQPHSHIPLARDTRSDLMVRLPRRSHTATLQLCPAVSASITLRWLKEGGPWHSSRSARPVALAKSSVETIAISSQRKPSRLRSRINFGSSWRSPLSFRCR